MEPNQQTHSSYRINFDDTANWLAQLQKEGFVVIGGVVSHEDCEKILQAMKLCLTKLSPNLKIDNQESWSINENYPPMGRGGMIDYVAHTKFQWELREKVTPVFAKVWNCAVTDLATSFDGFCFMNGKRNYSPVHPLQYVHTDQSPQRDYLWTVQGLLNLCDNEETDGGLVVVPGSHKTHHQVLNEIGKGDVKADWYKFSEEDKKNEKLFAGHMKVCAKAGDFIIWDSRLFHSYMTPTSQNIRACAYICQVPKDKMPEEVKGKRGEAWKEKRCSSHAPGEGFELFGALPKNADPVLKERVEEVSVADGDLSDIQKSLLCI
jgi:ectoine hydroxylase-related dioxygenase (phytanoyl-CoA dioxygenase family)